MGRRTLRLPCFTFLSSRITQKRKQWLAEALGLDSPAQLKVFLGPHWWFFFGAALAEVILPDEYYKVGAPRETRWDDLGLSACARDWAKWPGEPSEDLAQQSRFNRLLGNRRFAARKTTRPGI